MPLYSVTYTFEADDDQDASNLYAGGFYLEADPTFSWRLLEPKFAKNEEAMTTAAHTPGPWIYEYSPWKAQDGTEIPAFEVHGTEKVCDTNESRPVEEQEANARLIAAAPDLLEALIEAKNLVDQHYDPVSDRVKQINAAIAKAKGGSL